MLTASGCSTMPLYRQARRPAALSADALSDGLRDFTGVIHIHTAPYSSDASGTLAKAIRVAHAQRLDYLLITEHNTLLGHEQGLDGRHGSTLVLIGEEISTAGGHYLALNVPHDMSRHQPTARVIEEIAAAGGLGFVPHPFWRRKPWQMWEHPDIVGMEIYNVAHAVMEEDRWRLLLKFCVLPPEWFYRSLMDRPYEALRRWDEITQRRRFVGIGGADAHEIQVLWMTFAPYEMLFRMVRTHVKAPSLSPEAVYTALREGHAYVGLETDANATGFTFLVRRQGTLAGIMGDEIAWTPGLELAVSVPQPATIMLLRDGSVVATRFDRALTCAADQPGVYRVEVELHTRPWIFSNPIYLRSPAAATR